ncbi:N-acetyltransferase [Schizosaccharomyces pombe]|uniref:Uncharacterized N-acetyltransferase C550.08 n=1 Tax=Schizosaccharomyces pombe (strain 972 / ATCC 24843) TaxID=284812 RepID=YJV8_SCHPO|nr:putative N-acetyltransferase [Schizosaccharomyces pombe]O59806.1 RecName: Full=Uncharacterized N-acetyltransferase C550.08 [Schizosaccharomyces pombe 972h-]CAA19112.1 N-acetyltransferase (predicted) [Schizosaccharomyces pombe]|eukprot:NP_588100.1 putative N-acetyltransferase [Schizosaccharomyces pombe]
MAAKRVEAKDYKKAAATLVDAFFDDPVCVYLCHTTNEQQFKKLMTEMFEYIVYAHIIRGLVLEVGDFAGISLWMGPGNNMDDWYSILRSGLWRLKYKLDGEGRKRFFNEFLPILNDTKADVLKERDDHSWYLVYVGVSSKEQGKGYLRKLIEPIFNICDQEGLPIYLESSHLHNRPIYEHFGFVYQQSIYLTRDNQKVPLEIMIREPETESKAEQSAKPKAALSKTVSASIAEKVEGSLAVSSTPVC